MTESIERLKASDAREAAEIEAICFGAEGWSEQAFIDTLKLDYAYYLCARLEGRLIGLAGARLIAGEAYISNVSVLPEFRRRGTAYRVMRELLSLLEDSGAQAHTLEVRSANKAAIGLYEKLGFKSEGLRKDFYTAPRDDAVIMWKR